MHIFSRLKIQADHFKMVRTRNGSEIGPLPSIEGFTNYSTDWRLDLYWNDNAKNINIVKKHIYDIFRNWLRYPDDVCKKAVNAADIHLMKLPEEHLKQFKAWNPNFEPKRVWEVEIKMSLK